MPAINRVSSRRGLPLPLFLGGLSHPGLRLTPLAGVFSAAIG